MCDRICDKSCLYDKAEFNAKPFECQNNRAIQLKPKAACEKQNNFSDSMESSKLNPRAKPFVPSFLQTSEIKFYNSYNTENIYEHTPTPFVTKKIYDVDDGMSGGKIQSGAEIAIPNDPSSSVVYSVHNEIVSDLEKGPMCKLTNAYDAWERELENDHNREFILNGIKHGFDILEGKHPDFKADSEKLPFSFKGMLR